MNTTPKDKLNRFLIRLPAPNKPIHSIGSRFELMRKVRATVRTTAAERNRPPETSDTRPRFPPWKVERAVNLGAGDTLVLQDPDYDTPVFILSLRCGIRGHLLTGAHCAWGQNVCQGNLILLLQDIRHVLGAFTAQLLVESSTANPRCIALHLNDVANHALDPLSQFQQLWLILFLDRRTVISEEDCY